MFILAVECVRVETKQTYEAEIHLPVFYLNYLEVDSHFRSSDWTGDTESVLSQIVVTGACSGGTG